VKISRSALAAPLAVALAIPAFAIGQADPTTPNENAKPAGAAYGVMCQREGFKPGSADFRTCMAEHRKGVSGQKSAAEAAREICKRSDPPAEDPNAFGKCVSSTRTLILGLRGLKAQ
jgi:hypothetical protein